MQAYFTFEILGKSQYKRIVTHSYASLLNGQCSNVCGLVSIFSIKGLIYSRILTFQKKIY